MKKSPSPPPAPDPVTSANAQSQANIQTAIANARLNRINQTTPFGSLTYTQTGTDANGVPIYESHIALSPAQQALLDKQQQGQNTRSTLANSVLSSGSANISKPLDLSALTSVFNPYSKDHQWGGPSFAPPAAGPAGPAAPPLAAPDTGPAGPPGAMQQQMAALLRGAGGATPGDQLAPGTQPPAPVEDRSTTQVPVDEKSVMASPMDMLFNNLKSGQGVFGNKKKGSPLDLMIAKLLANGGQQ